MVVDISENPWGIVVGSWKKRYKIRRFLGKKRSLEKHDTENIYITKKRYHAQLSVLIDPTISIYISSC